MLIVHGMDPPPTYLGGGGKGKWPPPGAENLEKVGGPPYCGGTSIDRVIVGGWSLNTVKLLNFQQFGLLNSKNFGAARHFLSGLDNFICSLESAVQKHCRNESCLRGNDYFLWRELDSLLHDSAVLVGGPLLSRYVGGPQVLGGPNFLGGASDPFPYHDTYRHFNPALILWY